MNLKSPFFFDSCHYHAHLAHTNLNAMPAASMHDQCQFLPISNFNNQELWLRHYLHIIKNNLTWAIAQVL